MIHLFFKRTSIVLLLLPLLWGCGSGAVERNVAPMAETFDWQGHRGARGLAPENSVAAFLKALEYPAVKTLELDVVVSQDGQVVVSHEPWMSHEICSHPSGEAVTEDEAEELLLYRMPYGEIRTYDCGRRGNARFPEQRAAAAVKPTLREAVEAVEAYCAENRREPPIYNVEMKSRPEWDGQRTPPPAVFARLVVEELDSLGIAGRTCIQSFDPRSLQAVRALRPDLTLALLIETPDGVETNLEALGFTPQIYSPYYRMVSAAVVQKVHDLGMRIVPWTVNTTEEMETLIEMGVDGIITDYPDRIPR